MFNTYIHYMQTELFVPHPCAVYGELAGMLPIMPVLCAAAVCFCVLRFVFVFLSTLTPAESGRFQNILEMSHSECMLSQSIKAAD